VNLGTVFGITLWKNKITKIAKIIIGGVFIVYGLTIVFNLIVDPTEHTHEINEDVSDEFRSMVKTYLTGEFIFLSDYDYKSMIITWKGNSIVVRTPGRMLWLFYRGSGSQQNLMNWTVDPLEIN